MAKINIFHALTAVVLFFGGATSIVWSVHVKKYDAITYNVNTTGIVTSIAPLALSFVYSYFVEKQQYENTWLPSSPFVNTTQSIQVTYASMKPECSIIQEIPGSQLYGICGAASIVSATWFWPLLLIIGILAMTTGSMFGFNVLMRSQIPANA